MSAFRELENSVRRDLSPPQIWRRWRQWMHRLTLDELRRDEWTGRRLRLCLFPANGRLPLGGSSASRLPRPLPSCPPPRHPRVTQLPIKATTTSTQPVFDILQDSKSPTLLDSPNPASFSSSNPSQEAGPLHHPALLARLTSANSHPITGCTTPASGSIV